jgi:RHS repeat-associated protein
MRATAVPDLSSYSYSGTGYVTSDANMNVAQWFDYAPYGSVIASTNTGTTKAGRQYIGQFTDDSGLSYLNARFYNSRQGQFLTEEPIFLALGDANGIGQLSGQDQQTYLSDPQQLNSTSYGRSNPITKKDTNGKQYTDVGGAFTVPIYGVPVGPTGGVQFTANGDAYVYLGVGVSLRPGPSGSIMYSPSGSPSEGWSGSINVFPPGARGIGGQGGYSLDSTGKFVRSGEFGIGTQGFGGSIVYTVSLANLLNELGGPLQNVTTPMTYYSVGMLSSSLPSSVIQGGTTYYRNSSGLLSTTPQSTPTQAAPNSPSGGGGGYGTPGTVYTNFVPGNAHSACGTLCQ